MIKCSNCGHKNLDEARFCEKCGVEFMQGSFCPSCGKPNDPDALFCEHCGVSISEKTPPVHPALQPVVVQVETKQKRRFSLVWLLLLLLIPVLCFFVPEESVLGGLLPDLDQVFPEDSPIGELIPKIQNILPKISIRTKPPQIGPIDSCADFQNAAKQNLSASAVCAADGTSCDVIIAGAEVFALNVDVSYINHGFDTDITCKLENGALICPVSKTKAGPVPDVTIHHEIVGGQMCAYNLQPAITNQDDEPVCCNRIGGLFYNQSYADGIFSFDLTCGDPSFPGFPVGESRGVVYDKSGKSVSDIACSRQENIAFDMLRCESIYAYNYTDPDVSIKFSYLSPNNWDMCEYIFEYEINLPDSSSSNNGECAPTATSNRYPWCRSGPGTGYSKITFIEPDQVVTITRMSGSGNWWEVEYSNSGATCWVADEMLAIEGDTSCVKVVTGIEIDGENPPPDDTGDESTEDDSSGSEDPGGEESECLSPSDPACEWPDCPCCRPCVQF